MIRLRPAPEDFRKMPALVMLLPVFSNDTEKALPALGSDKYLGSAVMLGDLDRDGDNDLIVTTDLANYSGVGVRPTRQLEFK